MLLKLIFILCISVFINVANANEGSLPMALIELLGEFDADETVSLEAAMSDIAPPTREDNKQTKEAGATDENLAQ